MQNRTMHALAACVLLGALGATSDAAGEAGRGPPVALATAGDGAAAVETDAQSARIALGRKLFMDRRLSRNGTMSCGMCHVPEQGFTSNELATAVGIEGRSLRRNAPSVLEVGRVGRLFHDGRAATLEEQAWGPLLARDEMGNIDRADVVARVAALPAYASAFRAAFGGGVTVERIGAALAAYQRSLDSGASRFDRWYARGDAQALSAQEVRGFTLFTGRAGCARCHVVAGERPAFSDGAFHNLGVGWHAAQLPESVTVALAPGVTTALSRALVQSVSEAPVRDDGRHEVTGAEADRGAFRTPTLRNVALTAPYMHDGSVATLRAAVDLHDRGGAPDAFLDPLMRPLHLGEEEKDDVVAFLRALTGEKVDELARQARAAASTPSSLRE